MTGRLLALAIAYSLAIQALMASVGLGMSAFAADAPAGLAICAHADAGPRTPAGDRVSKPPPKCPFCFVASQSAGYIPLVAEAPPLPAYAGRLLAPVSERIADRGHVFPFRRMAGSPRAPPRFSV